MALTQAQQAELLRRYLARQATLNGAGGRVVTEAWAALDSFDTPDIARLRTSALSRITVIGQRAASLSAGYLGLVLGEPVVAATDIVEPDWPGPFARMWAAFGRGDSFDVANEAGRAQADAVGRNSVVSTARQVGDLLRSDQVTGWQRVLSGDSCEWCQSVAGGIYETASSADFGHDRCNCGVTPILR
jgi:hypothetical protein